MFDIYMPSQLSYHFGFENMILWIQSGNVCISQSPSTCLNGLNLACVDFHLSFDYRTILVFVNLVLWIQRCNVACMMSLWEEINVFHNLTQCASTTTISLDLAISPLCQFSLGLSSGSYWAHRNTWISWHNPDFVCTIRAQRVMNRWSQVEKGCAKVILKSLAVGSIKVEGGLSLESEITPWIYVQIFTNLFMLDLFPDLSNSQ